MQRKSKVGQAQLTSINHDWGDSKLQSINHDWRKLPQADNQGGTMGNSPVKKPVLRIVSLSLIFSWVVLCVGGQCHDGERGALTKFRNGLNDPLKRLSSWANHSDCCRWRGIACDKKTGYVTKLDLQNPYPILRGTGVVSGHGYWNLSGRLDLSLLELKHLRYVDLSLNSFEGNSIPAFLGSLSELRYLNLSYSGFYGNIPPQLGNLSKLEYLDVSSNSDLAIDSLQWLGNMHNLRYLDMTSVDLERAGEHWLHMINQLPLLQEFRCEYCRLTNLPPTLSFINFTSITVLDLSGNFFPSTIPNWMANLSHLVSLDLSWNMFNGTIPDWLPELHFLQEIKLAVGTLYGEIPMSIGNITSLVELDLSKNRINGSIPESISNLHQLEHLDLSYNNIEEGGGGAILDKLCQLKKLKVFSLARCNLTGTIPACLEKISSLEVINLQSNQLDGALPESVGQLAQLSELLIGNNSLSGTVSEVHFKYLSKLVFLDLSSNFLILQFKDDWSPPFNLSRIWLRSCHLGPQFPIWLKTQKQLFELDISNANISGNLPAWFWDISLHGLNLSRNMIEAKLPNTLKVHEIVDLSYNLFWGPISSMLDDIRFVDISNNKFSGPLPHQIGQSFFGLLIFLASNNQISGTIPMSIGGLDSLLILDLSKNNLSGSIPPTIGNFRKLIVLDLSENFLQGDIPETIGSITQLQYLHMGKNNLSGQIPYSIYNCSNLKTVDLGENRLFGNIPAMIGNLSHLRKLQLRSNLLSGKIPPQLAQAQSIHVLDLAHNNLTGLIPPSFGKMFAKKNPDDDNKLQLFYNPWGDLVGIDIEDISTYMDYLFVLRKGLMQKYNSTLFLVTSLDLSNNNLEGKIPKELTNISNLLLLNLSHNHFTGNIPKNIGKLGLLESLDLSSNQLFGSIPQSLSFLTSLSNLNLSYNNLSGRIPSGPQLQVLDYPSIYWGNPELCGPPLIDMCPGDNRTRVGEGTGDKGQENETDGNEETDMLWVYSGIAPGFVVGFSGVLLILMFKESWRLSFFQFVDTLSTKLSLHA